MLGLDPVAWIIVATWMIGHGLIALIRAWRRRNEDFPRRGTARR